NYQLLDKLGAGILKNIFVYDYYWRMHRNLNIRSVNEVQRIYKRSIHPSMIQLIQFQSKVPSKLLKFGIASKVLMFVNYLRSYFLR
ncbi:MAG TPA: hypothetical protein VM368_08705, partial [Flavisolibacter sp.]|nr:hypothetical protein [Flavisolibacter sp.]